MKTAAVSFCALAVGFRPSLAARFPDFVTLMKPRVMALAVFTALVGLMIAPARPESTPWVHCNSRNRRGSVVPPACSTCGTRQISTL
mgnify:CR=1 FL=1